jgi:MFS family permease
MGRLGSGLCACGVLTLPEAGQRCRGRVRALTTAVIIFISRIGDIAGVALSGPLADLLKRKTVAYFAIGVTTVLCYPFVLAMLANQVALILVLQFLITLFGIGLPHGLAPILTLESVPTKYRYSGTGISYNLSAIPGGGIAPSERPGRPENTTSRPGPRRGSAAPGP